MGRPKKFNITEEQFKKTLLKLYVDGEGNKRSDREILSSQEMFNLGVYKEKGGIKCPESTGLLSYWKKKLKLNEYDVYKYYKNLGVIKISYPEWSKKNNKGRKRISNGYLSDDKIKHKMLDHFGMPSSELTLLELEEFIIDMYNTLGYDGANEIKSFYQDLKNEVS